MKMNIPDMPEYGALRTIKGLNMPYWVEQQPQQIQQPNRPQS